MDSRGVSAKPAKSRKIRRARPRTGAPSELLTNRANIDAGAYATGDLTLMTIQGTSMLAV